MPTNTNAPNVVVILFDDLGFAQLGCFGADIETPNIDRLAAGGLRYNQFHVTALCSPTRASLLTGRNHHAVGVGFLVDIPLDLPGYHCRPGPAAATLPRLLRDAGWSTMAVGKWHLTPSGERTHAGPFTNWPLGYGFESYYGFLQGDTNHWAPHLVRDNHYVDPPASPEDSYHLTEDLAHFASRAIVDRRQSAPGKPFFLYFSLGAMHAPHHVARDWVEPYAGRFDDGWEAWRERAFSKQLQEGVVPEGTTLTPRPPWVPAWDELSPDARRLFARMQETYAGFLTHTDAQIGAVLDSLEAQGVLDDTIVLLMSDNGASAEGGQIGTFNEHRFSNALPESVEANLPHADDWGGFRSYSHYAWGWAWAGNTPFRLWKRYAWLGGTRTPLIVHWPAGIEARGEVRSQFCHSVDIMPTVLDACGVDVPDVVDGIPQKRVDGDSILETFDDPAAPPPRTSQYFEMLGSRSMYLDGWKATTNHVSAGVQDEERLLEGSRDFDQDRWELFDLETDFSEARDRATEEPEVLARLVARWDEEAEANNVLPMEDSLTSRLQHFVAPRHPPLPKSVFRPTGSPVPDGAVPMLIRGGRIAARGTTVVDPNGVLCALGDWTSGYALFVKDQRLSFALSIGGEQTVVVAQSDLPIGRLDVSCTIRPDESGGTGLVLCHGQAEVGRGRTPLSLPIAWQHGGTALCLGFDRGFPVCDDYRPPFPWNGTLDEIVVDASSPVPESVADALRHD